MTIYNTRDLRAEFAPDGESSPSEQAANAKLLLAAPAMLAALKTAVELLGRVDSADPICDDWRTEISMSEIQDAIKAATFVANV